MNPRFMNPFDVLWKEYDSWYDRNREFYLKELELLKRNLPEGFGLEVGVGTGRFALVDVGIDVSLNMLKVARKRGVEVVLADALKLPFKRVFDFVLFAFTICFLEKPEKAIQEAGRVLKDGGRILLLFVTGKLAEEYRKKKSPFYTNARFYSVDDVCRMLVGFEVERVDYADLKYGKDVALVKAIKLPDG